MQLGEKVQELFREHLEGDSLYKASRWTVEQKLIPLGGARFQTFAYMETMRIEGLEPKPSGRSQLSLVYQISQDAFTNHAQAVHLGTRALTDRKPSKISKRWIEQISINGHNCHESKEGLIYAVSFNELELTYGEEQASAPLDHGNELFMAKGNFQYNLRDPSLHFRRDMEMMREMLSEPEKVLGVFAKIWMGGTEPKKLISEAGKI